ncbi:MAG: hypothetical protein K6D97_06135 [Clostridia bacterium]|nr:hypothetical protein [Clostridia bacterium]
MGLFTSRDDDGFEVGDFVRIKSLDVYGFVVDVKAEDGLYMVKWTGSNNEDMTQYFELDDLE